jgi:uncharacterized flavoprotein (TIGR03862 family)
MKKSIAIIGSGPAALILAAKLDPEKFTVRMYEKNQAAGRKFLVAGKGGFNLSHSDPPKDLIEKYTSAAFFEPLIHSFSNSDLRNWYASIGIPTFVGSSKRIFPSKEIKPIEVLNSILTELKRKGVEFVHSQEWIGWNENQELLFRKNKEVLSVSADITVFALGGGSWKVTGSDGSWTSYFREKGIEIIPFQASNCAFNIKWSQPFLDQAEGKALKNIAFSSLGNEKKGEAVITRTGIEGGAIYALSRQIRKQLSGQGSAEVFLDLKPAFTLAEIKNKVQGGRGTRSWTKHLEDQLRLDKIKIALLKEILSKDDFMIPDRVADKIKKLPLHIHSLAPLDDAISTVGGISLEAIDSHFQFKQMPGNYAIGEMLDWDAPTGGYLLQGCFSMGSALADYLNKTTV